jgi:hypothetical protein
MPLPKHLATAHFGWEYPELGAEADIPADLKRLLEQIEAVVHALNVEELGNAGAGDAGKLLVVGPGGINAWKAMSGDATFSSAGALTIGNEKISTAKLAALAVTEAILGGESVSEGKIKALAVTAAKLAAACVEESKIKNLAVSAAKLAELAVTTAKLAELCVTEAKIADGAVSSRKYKPTVGHKPQIGGGPMTPEDKELFQTKLEITPAVKSWLKVNAVWDFEVFGATICVGSMYLNGVVQAGVAILQSSGAAMRAAVAQNYMFELPAGVKATLFQAQRFAGGPTPETKEIHTGYYYELFAA